MSTKILKKSSRKKSFLANIFNKFARKIPCNMIIFSSAPTCEWATLHPITREWGKQLLCVKLV